MDHFTEKSYTGYGQNIGNSLKGIFFGFILLIGSIVLLWWNEGRSVEQSTALNEMKAKIITLSDTKYATEYEGKAALVQGEVKPLNELADSTFGINFDGLKLKRIVTMYQWRENKSSKSEDKLGGGTETVTTYDYVKEWSSSEINSDAFRHPQGHQNPKMLYRDETFVTDAKMGDFHLDKKVVDHISASEDYVGLHPTSDLNMTNHQNFLYIGKNAQKPQIGDIKISYKVASSGIYSFAAKIQGETLTYYTTKNGKKFIFVRDGKVTAESIFDSELESNAILTWILRGVGLTLMFVGFSTMMNILSTLAKVIPMLGSLVGGVTGIIAGILTLVLGSFVIALAWLSSRPLLSLGILAGGVIIAISIAKFGKKKEAQTNDKTST
ncbi:MAG: TMEM43 family protein [Campylobacterales bacterium]|nr:TMEM43 family protein [Campylobacterales bacterium]